jgi:hypothetical protein
MADPDKIAKLRQQRRELEIEADLVLHNPLDPTRALSEEDRVKLARIHKLIAGIDAALEAEVSGVSSAEPGHKVIWGLTARAWGEWVYEAFDKGGLPQASSRTNALEIFAKFFLWRDPRHTNKPPKPFNINSVRESLKHKDDYVNPTKKAPR